MALSFLLGHWACAENMLSAKAQRGLKGWCVTLDLKENQRIGLEWKDSLNTVPSGCVFSEASLFKPLYMEFIANYPGRVNLLTDHSSE
jgi:hypothetical protein